MPVSKKALVIGASIGVGAFVLGGGLALGLHVHNKKKTQQLSDHGHKAKDGDYEDSDFDQEGLQINNYETNLFPPYGRPYGDPFRARNGGVWGHDIWAYRTPRMRPVSSPDRRRRM